jgi:hypothetical protein
VLLAIGISGIQVVPVLTIVERWFSRRRGTALGIVSMGIGT